MATQTRPLLGSARTVSRLSYLAPLNGVLNVWVGSADDPTTAKPVTSDTHRGIRIHFWAFTNNHVLYIQDKDGDENWHVYSVDLNSNQITDLTPVEGATAQIEQINYKFPAEIIVGLNDRDPQLHDLYRVNITTGERTLIQKNEGFAGFVIDDDYNVRFAMRMTPDGGGGGGGGRSAQAK